MSNGNIYDPTAQVGTAIAERKYKKTQADIERRKEWAKVGRDTVWELAKAGSKFQRERMNAKMFGAKIPGFDDVSIYKRKNYDNIIDEAISKVWTKPSNFEYTSSAKRYMSDLSQVGGDYGPEGSQAFKDASDALKADYPDVYGDGKNLAKKFKKHFGKAMKDKPLPKSSVTVGADSSASSTASSTVSSTVSSWKDSIIGDIKTTAGKDKFIKTMAGMDKSGRMFNFRGNPKPTWESKIPLVESGKPKTQLFGKGFEKGMAGLQVGAGVYGLLPSTKGTTAQKFGAGANVALGANALLAYGGANLWNPTGWGALAAGLGASLAQSGAFG